MVNSTGQPGKILILPDQDTIEVPSQSGIWKGFDGVLLERLAQGLKTGEIQEDVCSIDSIPDMWARFLLFQTALFNDTHPLHKQILSEWRGLLAILALKERRSLPLHTQFLQISETDNSKFVRAACKLLPQEKIANDTPWDKMYLLFYGAEHHNDTMRSKPIGATSPVTLVCTAAELTNRLDDKISWFENGRLLDPCDRINKAEKNALRFWLEQVKNGFQNYSQLSQDRDKAQNSLVRQLKAFIGDLGNGKDDSCRLSSRDLHLDTGLYKALLNHPVETKEISLEESSVRLIPSEGMQPEFEILVLDSNLAARWGIENPAEILVYGKETLASLDLTQLGSNRQVLVTPTESTRLIKAEWRKSEDFFTDKLLLKINSAQERDASFPNTLTVKGQHSIRFRGDSAVPILPIASELLNYFTPKDLAKKISFREVAPDTIAVELELTLSGVDGVEKTFTVSKTYSPQSIKPCPSVPVLEVWPNFRADNWNLYYTYYDAVGQRKTDIFYARPHTRDGKSTPRRYAVDSALFEITKSDQPPIAMVCAEFVSEERIVDVGCLLLDPNTFPPVESKEGGTWTIGVDFGTSSSNIYALRDSETEPFPIRFADRCVQITPSAKDSREDNMIKYFLPPFEPETPFASLFRLWRDSQGQSINEDKSPFLYGNIRYIKSESTVKGLNQDGVKSGFKWDSSSEYIEGFLKQLAIQCLAEAVKEGINSINWHISYPIAFGDNEELMQKNVWEDIVNLCQQVGIQSSEAKYETESFSVAVFFKEKEKVPLAGTICIDIGGRTSDISIWGDGRLLQQSSVKFAGEDCFTRLLKAKPSVLKKFGIEIDSELEKELNKSTNSLSEIDSLLRKPSVRENYKKWLPKIDIRNREDSAYGLLHLTALGLSGLFFYTGLLLCFAREEKKWKNDYLPHLCIGGNGARTLNWLGLGIYRAQTPHNRLFNEILNVSSGISSQSALSLRVSSKPKSEVAYGLVVPTELRLEKPDEAKVILSGEDFRSVDGNRFNWNTNLTAKTLRSGVYVLDTLLQLEKFVKVFNDYADTPGSRVRKIDLSRHERTIRERMQDWLNNLKCEQDLDRITPEPLFIRSLRELLQLETDDWVKRSQ